MTQAIDSLSYIYPLIIYFHLAYGMSEGILFCHSTQECKAIGSVGEVLPNLEVKVSQNPFTVYTNTPNRRIFYETGR